MRFNGGHPRAQLGTNLLTIMDDKWKPVDYIDIPDNDLPELEEDDSWIDKFIEEREKNK